MKKLNLLISFALVFTMLFTIAMLVYADEPLDKTSANTIILQINSPIMIIDGKEVPIDNSGTTPIVSNGTTLLPVRAVVEAMGGTVSWDGNSRTVTLNHEKNEVKLTIDSKIATFNGNNITLDVSPTIVDGKTMLPIRFVAESFGYKVYWEQATSTVTLTKNVVTKKETEKLDKDKDLQKTLVVYFSMPETTNPNGMTQDEENSSVVINGEVLGNVQYMAYVIQESAGGDIFRIEPQTPYPTNHEKLVNKAEEEGNQKFRPVLKAKIENLEQYDTIYLGYPNWWGDLPMIMYSFLEQHDFSGKTIIPFNAHGGSGFSNTINTIDSLQPNAIVIKDGLSISRNDVENAESEIKTWVEKIMSK